MRQVCTPYTQSFRGASYSLQLRDNEFDSDPRKALSQYRVFVATQAATMPQTGTEAAEYQG